MTLKRKLRPVLISDWWLIGPSPDLKGKIPGAEEWEKIWIDGGKEHEHNAPVDHHIFQDPKGVWHLWGCVRATSVGRVFYHWKTGDIRSTPWECTGEVIRINNAFGESYGSSPGEGEAEENDAECIQSPYFIKVDEQFFMFYGGGVAKPTEVESKIVGNTVGRFDGGAQMCLMTSEDGIEWTRYKNNDGNSRLFIGPGPTRDPVLVNIEGLWYMYYAGTKNNDPAQPVFWCRTSDNLYDWSEPILIHEDLNFGKERWDTECPVVVFRDGYFYLFRTEDYYASKTHVFRSEDPLDFGIGDASDKYVGIFPSGAPEIYEIDGKEYVSSNHDPKLGTQMAEMGWEEDW